MGAITSMVVGGALMAGSAVKGRQDAKKAGNTFRTEGDRLAAGQRAATDFQVDAEEKALKLRDEAAKASQLFLETGNEEARIFVEQAKDEMQRIIGQSQFDQQSLANPAFQERMNTIAQGFDQAISTQQQAQTGQLNALATGTQQAVQAGQPFTQAGTAGIQAFQQSALDPNNPLFNKRLAEGSEALNKQLAARGQFNSGAGLELQRDFIENATLEEQQNQINRQAQLAQLGQPQIGMQQQLLANQGQNTANVIGQGGQNIANLQTGGAGAQSDLVGQRTGTNLQIQQNAANLQSGIVGQSSNQLANLATQNAANLSNITTGAAEAQAVGESGLGAIKGQGELGVAEAIAQSRINAAKIKKAAGDATSAGMMKIGGSLLTSGIGSGGGGGGGLASLGKGSGVPLNSNRYSNIS